MLHLTKPRLLPFDWPLNLMSLLHPSGSRPSFAPLLKQEFTSLNDSFWPLLHPLPNLLVSIVPQTQLTLSASESCCEIQKNVSLNALIR